MRMVPHSKKKVRKKSKRKEERTHIGADFLPRFGSQRVSSGDERKGKIPEGQLGRRSMVGGGE